MSKKVSKNTESGNRLKYRPQDKFDESQVGNYCQTIFNVMSQGKTLAHLCVELHVGKSSFHEWMTRDPRLAEAYELGKLAGEAMWADIGVEMMKDAKTNAKQYQFQMRNRYSWKTKDEETHINIALNDDSERRRIIDLIKTSADESRFIRLEHGISQNCQD